MSKYRIIDLVTCAVLATESTQRNLKVAFNEATKKFRDKSFVAIDHNGETYARFIGGEVRPGQHYRKFTQRGTSVTPKVTRTAAPAPLPTNPEEYRAAQEKWLKDNGLKVGDKVRVVKKVEGYANGWTDVWSGYMTKEVGKIGTIVRDEFSGGLVVNTGCGRNYRYPFFSLEKA